MSRTITLRNAGDLSAGRLIAINLGGGFSQQTGGGADCSTQTQLGGGSTCNVRGVFSPTAARRFDVTLSVTSQQGGTVTLALSGTGLAQDDGTACTTSGQCASGNCVDGVCCENACNGACRQCRPGTGRCDVVPADDNACGVISCNVDPQCAEGPNAITTNRCAGLGVCRDSSDCGISPAPEGLACDAATSGSRLCDGEGECVDPVVQCGIVACETELTGGHRIVSAARDGTARTARRA